jgi:hypothetical protein
MQEPDDYGGIFYYDGLPLQIPSSDYSLCMGFTLFLIDRYGTGSYYRLIRGLNHQNFRDRFAAIYPESFSSLQSRWLHEYVLSP